MISDMGEKSNGGRPAEKADGLERRRSRVKVIGE